MTPSTAQSKSARQHAEQQWKDYELRRIEQRLGIVLATIANLRAEQAQLMQQKEQIINPPPPPRQRVPKGEGRNREKRNAYMRVYLAKVRAERQTHCESREKYNEYHKEYQRRLRTKQRAEKLLNSTQTKEHHI